MFNISVLLLCFFFSFTAGDPGAQNLNQDQNQATSPEKPQLAESQEIPEINGMVYIPPGEFLMGSTQEDLWNTAESDEFPQRSVWIDGFYIDLYEVTNVQYKLFVDSLHVEPPLHWKNGNYPVGWDGYPVTGITWHDAKRYAEFVGKRLPTEEEWEKAARGTDGRRFPWGDEFDKEKANNAEQLLPIMRFPEGVSPYGVYDMAGNAAEWVDAWFSPYPRGENDQLDPDYPKHTPIYGKKKYRVYRGGSFNSFGKYLRCANREKEKPSARWGNIGFRCAMDPPWETK